MESIWWVFQQIWKQKMVYQGHKSLHICPRCETPLSNFEVNQGYKDITDLGVTVKFKSLEEKNTYFLAWTTTPWTLPGNTALAVGSNLTYAKVKQGGNYYYLAKNLVPQFFDSKKDKVVATLKGQKLVGQKYEPLLLFENRAKLENEANGWQVYPADFVSTEDGTGLVHCAPAFGEDDMNLGKENNLPFIQHVQTDGTFVPSVKPWVGKFVKAQDQNIADYLSIEGKLFKSENYRHSYPHCWRCDTPLLNYACKTWFIRVTELAQKLQSNNQKIHWQPDHLKEGRFGKWLAGAKDWAISRNRFWGCPIPIWECPDCGKQKCVGSIDELKKHSIRGKLPKRKSSVDLHIPYIDEIKFKCSCGGVLSRVPEVLDCWFESGSMPYAQLHYPFENKKLFENNFPADFIAEGLDQTRGWFYTLHVLASILSPLIVEKNAPAFKNVIVNGILLAADGEKLSKRKKNYPDPHKLFETYGVDSMRYFLYSSTAPLAEDVRFSEKHVEEIVKKFILTLWNTFSFFVTYARIDKYEPGSRRNRPKSHKLDQWILSELNLLIQTVTTEMDDYNLTKATRPISEFVDNLSNWYVRRSRRRFWKSENDQDKSEAYDTLYEVLVKLSQLMAPFTPFLAEEIYRTLASVTLSPSKGDTPLSSPTGGAKRLPDRGSISVHLTDWPKPNRKLIKPRLNQEMRLIRQIVNLGHAIRAKAKIKVRQPLSKVQIALPNNINPKVIQSQKAVILEELNVKDLEFLKSAAKIVKQIIKPNARVLGPKYGQEVPKIFTLAKKGQFKIQPNGQVKLGKYLLEPNEIQIGYEGKPGFTVESEKGIVVILDTQVTEILKQEGHAREIVRFIQDLRKEANYHVSDRIYVKITLPKPLEPSFQNFRDYIQKETLTLEFKNKGPWDIEKKVTIEDQEITLALRR